MKSMEIRRFSSVGKDEEVARDLARRTLFQTEVSKDENEWIVYSPKFCYRKSFLVEDSFGLVVRPNLSGTVSVIENKYTKASEIFIRGIYGENWKTFDIGDIACDSVRSYDFLKDLEEGKFTEFIASSLARGIMEVPELDPINKVIAKASGYTLDEIGLSISGLGLSNVISHILGIRKYILDNFSSITKGETRVCSEDSI